MTEYLDKLGRKIKIDQLCSGKFIAIVNLKNSPNWKSFHPKEIRSDRDKLKVQEALDRFALKHHLIKID